MGFDQLVEQWPWLSGLDNGSRSQRSDEFVGPSSCSTRNAGVISTISTVTRRWDCLLVSIFYPRKALPPTTRIAQSGEHQEKLLQGWVTKLSHLFPEADSFSLDFHAIGHRGEETDLENHYQPLRGQAGPSVLTFFAMEQKKPRFLLRQRQSDSCPPAREIHRFVEFWRQLMGKNPQWLYFDSKLTTYEESRSRLNEQQVWFVTIRRRRPSVTTASQSARGLLAEGGESTFLNGGIKKFDTSTSGSRWRITTA